ncbi:flagellin [Clostridium sp. MD294]|uniref:flagellin N-terminal helical domain-containing protein n=1 Tax=Clostridium sp. MD294 TaxID=97138 RepID=UPI0002CCC38F|nr:flagellin [Clostridium sp. MD294]USF29232.1 hypothetical protein C820_000617 [Clostridium sp. MD294]
MIIQHNIPALNSYNRLGANNAAVAKNLKKLSSGYKINSAADNAAGLAISEKMRAQITGLEACQQNSKDGISLVQTAEGALTEVHSMLNRMVELSTLASNGTYSDSNREKLQDEIVELQSEIDRIADSTNFNGIDLLNGNLSDTAVTSSKGATDVTTKFHTSISVEDFDATRGQYKTAAVTPAPTTGGSGTGGALASGDKITYNFEFTDAEGNVKTESLSFTYKSGTANIEADKLIAADGTEYEISTVAAPGTLVQTSWDTAVKAELQKNETIGENFKVTVNAAGDVILDSKETGANTLKYTGVNRVVTNGKTGANTTDLAVDATEVKQAENSAQYVDMSTLAAYDGTNLEKATFEVNGKKFVFIANGSDTAENLQKLKDAGIEHYVTCAAAGAPAAADVKAMVEKINFETGINASQGKYTAATGATGTAQNKWEADATKTTVIFRPAPASSTTKGGNGLNLQIGDTADDFNRIQVSIQDCHAKALGVGKIDVSTEKSAASGIQDIKDAIDTVSKIRAKLGATQNRLDHTLNNLETTTENLTESESRIRDTDMAKEMMQYTKNNILVQSSQAMLAQANQLPQGVLQLLQ